MITQSKGNCERKCDLEFFFIKIILFLLLLTPTHRLIQTKIPKLYFEYETSSTDCGPTTLKSHCTSSSETKQKTLFINLHSGIQFRTVNNSLFRVFWAVFGQLAELQEKRSSYNKVSTHQHKRSFFLLGIWKEQRKVSKRLPWVGDHTAAAIVEVYSLRSLSQRLTLINWLRWR